MSGTEIIFFTIKLVLGGLIAFLAIMVWSRIRDFSWALIVFAAVAAYSAVVFGMLERLGFVSPGEAVVFGNEIPLVRLIFSVIPGLLIIIALITMIFKTGGKRSVP